MSSTQFGKVTITCYLLHSQRQRSCRSSGHPLREQTSRRTRLLNFAPFLVQEHADTAFLGGDIFQVVEAVEQEIIHVGYIGLPLHP